MKTIGSRKQLFVDEYLVEKTEGVAKRFHPPKKHTGNPIFTPERPWEMPMIQAQSVLYDKEEKVYKMWYGGGYSACYATSEDGVHWKRPNLGIIEYEGSKQNNLIDGVVGRIVFSPEMRGKEPPGRLYKTLFDSKFAEMKLPKGWRGKAVSFSEDGIRWKPYERNPALVGALGDVNTVCRNPESTLDRFALSPSSRPWVARYEEIFEFYHSFLPRYLAFLKFAVRIGPFYRRSLGISYSENFTDWAYPLMVLAPDERDDELARKRIAAAQEILKWDHPEDHHAHFYGMDVFPYADMYLGFVYVFDAAMELARIGRENESGVMHIQLVTSRDLIHWERTGNRSPFLPLGDPDEIDSGMIVGTHTIIGDDTMRFYYSANNASHGGLERRDGKPCKTGVCLASSRLDGFVSVDAGPQEGTLLTKELSFKGKRLEINADASEGYVKVALLQDGRAVSGYSVENCDPILGDSVRHAVSWRAASDVSAFAKKPIQLRFILKNAKLYAFQFI